MRIITINLSDPNEFQNYFFNYFAEKFESQILAGFNNIGDKGELEIVK